MSTCCRPPSATRLSLKSASARRNFAYAARNFFWILPKRGAEGPFQPWESQELVLDVMAKMRAAGKAQRLMIIKARQLGMSTLIEALIAWRTMFFPNARGLVVSDDQDNSAELFSKLLHIYDHMPWWLKPMLDRRKEERLLVFDNPDDDMKDKEPGLRSRVSVQSASKMTGVGQGRTLRLRPRFRIRRLPGSARHGDYPGGSPQCDRPTTPIHSRFWNLQPRAPGATLTKFWRKQCELCERGALATPIPAVVYGEDLASSPRPVDGSWINARATPR